MKSLKIYGNALMVFLSVGTIFTSCIPPKQVEELRTKYERCEEERQDFSAKKQSLETENNELKAEVELLESKIEKVKDDTLKAAANLRRAMRDLDRQREINNKLEEITNELQSGSQAENRKLLAELQTKMEELQEKEDQLKRLEMELNRKKENLDILKAELEKREERVRELEDLIAQKDAAVRALKDRIKAALSGFEDKGIKVEQKNGRVYVSMEAKLLFASGSTSVGTEGSVAVVELAKALEGIEDLTILVEGHTDNDPIKTAFINDNWDLSVMRATSVVRIMIDNSNLDPSKLTAAGRGEFFPVAENDSRENKAKNRRIEVILTPNLDKLFELLEEGASANEEQN